MSYYDNKVCFSELVGKTIDLILVHDDTITFKCDDGSRYRMFHDQDCCESVSIEEIIGDFDDLIGSPITVAEERESNESPDDRERYNDDSETWTFYELATIKGSVTIRWYGTSNGYYSESVDFIKLSD